MARIDSKVLFVTTSPRTPSKMIPEISLLGEHFSGMKWDHSTQVAYMETLKNEDFFLGEGKNDPAFSARDRITRSPKALGFVLLKPNIQISDAGKALINSPRKEEILLRQLLKFQIPSPYHIPSKKAANFWVKPYLEIFRLIRHFGSLKFDELMIFGLQLVDYRNFDIIVKKIEKFRYDKANSKTNYKIFKNSYFIEELLKIYEEEINLGNTETRESKDSSLKNFLTTKARNMRDYTDACFRYLRATKLVNISHIGKSISIIKERIKDVDYFLNTIDRNPCFVNDKFTFIQYLTNISQPILYTDNKNRILNTLRTEFPNTQYSKLSTIDELKDILHKARYNRKKSIIQNQITDLKNYKLYDHIQNTFDQIITNQLYDSSLMLEWNTWRAMTMLNGGDIKANLKFDDYGNPMSTAQGNMADIVCDYGSFDLCVEVTMQKGQKQYEAESEPVSRHLAKLKSRNGRPAYCLFLAPKINEACIAHFYALHKMNISYYGGTSIIVPLPLNIFRKMIEDTYKVDYTPTPNHIEKFFKYSEIISKVSIDERDWYKAITNAAMNWLTIQI